MFHDVDCIGRSLHLPLLFDVRPPVPIIFLWRGRTASALEQTGSLARQCPHQADQTSTMRGRQFNAFYVAPSSGS